MLPNDLLHDLIRAGEQAVSTGVEQLHSSVDRLVQASIDRIGPVRRAREEMARLRERLEELESSLAAFEGQREQSAVSEAAAEDAGGGAEAEGSTSSS
jgi:polyhydroxyalkanoate synthesis regulator phasin